MWNSNQLSTVMKRSLTLAASRFRGGCSSSKVAMTALGSSATRCRRGARTMSHRIGVTRIRRTVYSAAISAMYSVMILSTISFSNVSTKGKVV